MMLHSRIVVIVAACALTVSCGSRVDPAVRAEFLEARSAPGQSVSPETDSGPGTGASAPSIGGPSPQPADLAQGEPEPEPSPATPSVPRDGELTEDRGAEPELRLEVSLAPACVAVGEQVTATIESEPATHLALAMSYSDGAMHNHYRFDRTDQDGSLRWTWTITPDVPPGPATLLVAASSEDDDRNGSGHGRFVVASPERGCS